MPASRVMLFSPDDKVTICVLPVARSTSLSTASSVLPDTSFTVKTVLDGLLNITWYCTPGVRPLKP